METSRTPQLQLFQPHNRNLQLFLTTTWHLMMFGSKCRLWGKHFLLFVFIFFFLGPSWRLYVENNFLCLALLPSGVTTPLAPRNVVSSLAVPVSFFDFLLSLSCRFHPQPTSTPHLWISSTALPPKHLKVCSSDGLVLHPIHPCYSWEPQPLHLQPLQLCLLSFTQCPTVSKTYSATGFTTIFCNFPSSSLIPGLLTLRS